MPDDQRVLLLRNNASNQTISTFDMKTGEEHVYAETQDIARAYWLPRQNAVAFLDQKPDSSNDTGQRTDLWLSYGDPSNVELIMRDTGLMWEWIDPAGYIIKLSGIASMKALPEKVSQEFSILSLPLDLKDWEYPKYSSDIEKQRNGYIPIMETALRKDGSQVVFYGDPWLFLVDTNTNHLCEIDLGLVNGLPRFAYEVKWSPDGRYLGMATSARIPGMVLSFSDLALLDTQNGNYYLINLGQANISDFNWSNDNRHLMILGSPEDGRGGADKKLSMVDVVSKDFRPLFPDRNFGGALPRFQIAWSDDGQKIAIVGQGESIDQHILYVIDISMAP